MCIGGIAAALVAAGCGGTASGGAAGAGGGHGSAIGGSPLPSPPSSVTLSRAARVDDVPLRMDIALLRRAGRVATLDLRLRSMAPHGGMTYLVGSAFAATIAAGYVDGIYLMDPTTGGKLSPIFRGGTCVCTTNGYDLEIAPGGTAMLTASFPAPSPAAHTADVIVPHFGAFRDVPLRG
jgi:hypothetical protein